MLETLRASTPLRGPARQQRRSTRREPLQLPVAMPDLGQSDLGVRNVEDHRALPSRPIASFSPAWPLLGAKTALRPWHRKVTFALSTVPPPSACEMRSLAA